METKKEKKDVQFCPSVSLSLSFALVFTPFVTLLLFLYWDTTLTTFLLANSATFCLLSLVYVSNGTFGEERV